MTKILHIITACLLVTFLLVTVADAQDVCSDISVDPASVQRGQTAQLSLTGTGIAGVSDITIDDDRIAILSISPSEDEILVELSVGQRSLADTKSLLVDYTEETTPDCTVGFAVVPGDVVLIALEPHQVTRGESASEVQLQGLNLDDVNAVTAVDGIDVTDYDPNESDPTLATALISVGDTVESGTSAIGIQGPSNESVLEGSLEVVPGNLSVAGLSPPAVERGETTSLTASGQNLDTVQQVNLGSGVNVLGTTLTDPTSLLVDVTVLAESLPVGTARDVVFSTADSDATLEDSFTVNAGDLTVERIRPTRITQDSLVEITVEGSNLDGLDEFDVGDGASATAFDVLSPTRAMVELNVADDAEIGTRDVQIGGLFGSALLHDGIVILERVDPPANINYPDVIDAGFVELGSRKRFSLTFINEVDITEEVDLEIASGDIDEFRLYVESGETLSEINPMELILSLGPLQEEVVIAEFRPSLPTGSIATLDVSARGERLGGVELRGTGIAPVLGFSPEPPITIPPVREGEIGFRQVSTLSDSPERTLIDSVEVVVEQDNGAFPDGASLTTVSLSEPLPPEEDQLFGATLITIETEYPLGTYEGEIWISTSRSTSPIVSLGFATTVIPALPADEASEEPVDTAPDAGPDIAEDMGTDIPVTPDLSDAEADLGDGDPADDADVVERDKSDGGCCRQAPGDEPGVGGWLVVTLLGLVVLPVLRRR